MYLFSARTFYNKDPFLMISKKDKIIYSYPANRKGRWNLKDKTNLDKGKEKRRKEHRTAGQMRSSGI